MSDQSPSPTSSVLTPTRSNVEHLPVLSRISEGEESLSNPQKRNDGNKDGVTCEILPLCNDDGWRAESTLWVKKSVEMTTTPAFRNITRNTDCKFVTNVEVDDYVLRTQRFLELETTTNEWLDGWRMLFLLSFFLEVLCNICSLVGKKEFSFVAVDSDVIETWELWTAGILPAREINRGQFQSISFLSSSSLFPFS